MTDLRGEMGKGETGSPLSPTSLSLVERMRRLEPESWRRFVQLYYPLIYGWCRRNRVRTEDAHDVVRDILQGITVTIDGFNHDSGRRSFRGWLWSITRNKIADHWRRPVDGTESHGDRGVIAPERRIVEPTGADMATERTLVCHRTMQAVREEFESATWQAFRREPAPRCKRHHQGAGPRSGSDRFRDR